MYRFNGTLGVTGRYMYLLCDPEVARYYRALAKSEGHLLVPQRYDSHVSVVRPEEAVSSPTMGKFLGEVVEVFGNPEYVQRNLTHFWFRVISPRLEDVRTELGLPNQPAVLDSAGKIVTHPFHLTFGRVKGT